MTFNKHPLVCSFLLLAITTLQAKTYSGHVINSETLTGLAGVSVKLLNSDGKATTDKDGLFSITAEVSVATNRSNQLRNNTLRWRSTAHAFDLSAAPQVKSIALFNLKGARLYFKDRVPGTDMLPLPGLPRSIYLIRISTWNDQLISTSWAHLGTSVSFTFGAKSVDQLSKQLNVVSALEFEKQGYQTKQTDIDNDSTYTAMVIKMKPEIGSVIFDDDTVRTYRFYFTETNMAELLNYGKLVPKAYTVNSVMVPASLKFEGRTLDSVGIRFRGDQI